MLVCLVQQLLAVDLDNVCAQQQADVGYLADTAVDTRIKPRSIG